MGADFQPGMEPPGNRPLFIYSKNVLSKVFSLSSKSIGDKIETAAP